ncbi:MCP four helix bundle domain-containing protein [Sphingobacterium sp. WQ 366]|uniref:MCP four helix bundle domain-containing protein n=2 Tax=Sphingobacterium bovistauri TaxID=2781959 RepID=A0ABS7Z546_9SPHI|nr:MCP four helix bundle domain-containing protein [Sphingobacterium bovistauri]
MIFKNLSFTTQNKIKTTTLIFSILCLILLTNIQERLMIKHVNESVTSLYEDRVVVGNYILQLSNYIEEISQLLKSNVTYNTHKIQATLAHIDTINIAYDKTYLTEKEKISFKKLIDDIEQIKEHLANSAYSTAFAKSLEAEKVLRILSSIQVEEGKNKLDEVLNMTSTRSFLSYLEIVIIIVISVLIQKIVLSTKPIVIKNPKDNHQLN